MIAYSDELIKLPDDRSMGKLARGACDSMSTCGTIASPGERVKLPDGRSMSAMYLKMMQLYPACANAHCNLGSTRSPASASSCPTADGHTVGKRELFSRRCGTTLRMLIRTFFSASLHTRVSE